MFGVVDGDVWGDASGDASGLGSGEPVRMTLAEGVGEANAVAVGEGDDINEGDAEGDASGAAVGSGVAVGFGVAVGSGVAVGFGVGVGVTGATTPLSSGGSTRRVWLFEHFLLKPKSFSVTVTDFSRTPFVLNNIVGEPCPLMISPGDTDQRYFGFTPGVPPFHSAVALTSLPATTESGQLISMYGQTGFCSLSDFGSCFEEVIEGGGLTSAGRFLVGGVCAGAAWAVEAEAEVGPPGLSSFRIVSPAKEIRMTAATATDLADLDKLQTRKLIALRLNEALFIGDMV